MMNLIILLVTSFLLTGTEARFRPCLIQYSDGSEQVIDCYPSGLFSCEQVNLTISKENMDLPGNPAKPVDHDQAVIVGLYLCKPRPCVNPASLSENQTAVECSNSSADSKCVAAADSMPLEKLMEAENEYCARPIPAGHFEDLATDPDIHFRCTISPEVTLAQLSCKAKSVEDGTVLSSRECLKGTRTCNADPSCRVRIKGEEVDLYFCDQQ